MSQRKQHGRHTTLNNIDIYARHSYLPSNEVGDTEHNRTFSLLPSIAPLAFDAFPLPHMQRINA